jgi:small subunit ribosomal protein S6
MNVASVELWFNLSLSARRPPAPVRMTGKPRERRNCHVSTTNPYEAVFILHPATPEEEQAGLVEKIKQYVIAGGGEVTALNSGSPWGRRKLAYPIRKVNEGYYTYMNISIAPPALPELERSLKLMEPLMRYLIIRL